MKELESQVIAWGREGFCCSQIMLLTGLAFRGSQNPELVASLEGLCRGGYNPEGTCGAFTGACCLLGFHAGKGNPEREKDPRLPLMIYDLHQWFCEQFALTENRISCGAILETLPGSPPLACSSLVLETLSKTLEILQEHHFDLQETPYIP
jgi:hypothetical protein